MNHIIILPVKPQHVIPTDVGIYLMKDAERPPKTTFIAVFSMTDLDKEMIYCWRNIEKSRRSGDHAYGRLAGVTKYFVTAEGGKINLVSS